MRPDKTITIAFILATAPPCCAFLADIRGQKHVTDFPLPQHRVPNGGAIAAKQKRSTARHGFLSLPSETDRKGLLSAASFVFVDVAFRRAFAAASIVFPSSLAACSFLFATMLAMPSRASQALFEMLQPGSQLLAKWLPVFFVPSLVTLPLGDGLGSSAELAKVGAVVALGFLFSLFTTAYAVTMVRSGTQTSTPIESDSTNGKSASGKPSMPYSTELFSWLLIVTALSGSSSVVSGHLRGVYLLFTTLSSFVFGSRLLKIKSIVHPLVTCTGLTWASMQLMRYCSPETTFISWLQTYKASAGRVLLFGLGPAVVSLAISMYERRQLMRDNLKAVGTSILVSTLTGLFGTAFAVRLLAVANPSIRLSLLSRNITSPLAMAIAGMLNADVSLAVSMVVVTGLLGANFGGNLLSAFGIKDGVARGLAIGSAAHGLGTAALAQEREAFPFAAIAMALTATAATVTVSIPFFRTLLVRIALG